MLLPAGLHPGLKRVMMKMQGFAATEVVESDAVTDAVRGACALWRSNLFDEMPADYYSIHACIVTNSSLVDP